MNFTPNEIQNLVFKKSARGFNQEQVWDFLEKVLEDYNSYIRENVLFKDRIEILEESLNRYKAIEETLQNTLLVAQQTADDIKRIAQREADATIVAAQKKATELVDHANDEVSKIKLQNSQIRKNFHVYKTQIECLIKGQLELLIDENLIDVEAVK